MHTGKMSCGNRGRNWGGALEGKELQRLSAPTEARRGGEEILPPSPQKDSLILDFQPAVG